jgi:hypothetical protein
MRQRKPVILAVLAVAVLVATAVAVLTPAWQPLVRLVVTNTKEAEAGE